MTRILIVDDEADIREVVREYAEINGYVADEALPGVGGIAACKLRHGKTCLNHA